MRLIDADAFDKVLKDAQLECKKNGGNFRYGVLATVRANLEKAPTVSGWVSVEEALPERYLKVLTYDTNLAIHENWIIRDTYWSIGYHITHWMPLPAPPEEVNRDA